ncbi:MAG TPA: hypothetical protein VI732_01225 [Alphaproteobacteria bacterium]|nr:hypothetical protein [Alphaproteobacteria bacterium]
MQIKPSADVLQALGSLPVDRVPGRPKVATAQAARPVPKETAPKQADVGSSRSYRPGTFLDIFV